MTLCDVSAKVNKICKHVYGGEGKAVSGIGILCDQDKEREKMIQVVEMLAGREGLDCSIYNIGQEMTDEWKNITCVILALRDRGDAFRCAEKLWSREPTLLIIYVANKIEDIIAALTMPFFHIVRLFGFEQDLEVAFQKLGKMRMSAVDKIKFVQNGQMMLVPSREILYMASIRHEISLHLVEETLRIKENLSQCEGRLKGKGFVRTYTSFLVNMYHIRCLEKEKVILDNGEQLYVSRYKYPEVKLMFENYIRHLDFI